MNLSAFVALCLGMFVEILMLHDRSEPQPTPFVAGAPTLSLWRQSMVILGILAALLITIFELTGLASRKAYMGTGFVDAIMVIVGVYVLISGLINPKLLPRVDEASILAVNTVVVLGLALNRGTIAIRSLILLAVPTLALLVLALSKRELPPLVKAMAYLWYLIGLLVLTVQNDFLMMVDEPQLSVTDGFLIGATGVFLGLHSLFLVRFFFMVSALILPRHRAYIAPAMGHLYRDEQARTWQILVLEGMVVALLLANRTLDLVPNFTAINVLVLLVAQGPSIPRLQALQRQPDSL